MNFRRVMPLLATLLAALWLIVSYTGIIPEDNFGYNQLYAIFLVEVMIFFFAVLCAVLSAWKVLPWAFTGSLFSVGPLHYWGAGVNAPACDFFFLPPLFAVLLTGLWTFFTAKYKACRFAR